MLPADPRRSPSNSRAGPACVGDSRRVRVLSPTPRFSPRPRSRATRRTTRLTSGPPDRQRMAAGRERPHRRQRRRPAGTRLAAHEATVVADRERQLRLPVRPADLAGRELHRDGHRSVGHGLRRLHRRRSCRTTAWPSGPTLTRQHDFDDFNLPTTASARCVRRSSPRTQNAAVTDINLPDDIPDGVYTLTIPKAVSSDNSEDRRSRHPRERRRSTATAPGRPSSRPAPIRPLMATLTPGQPIDRVFHLRYDATGTST